MPQLGPKTQGEERPEHIPAPAEATSVGEWHFFEGSCGHQYWIRHFGGRGWTVETSLPGLVEVELAGNQFSDGSIDMWLCLEGDSHDLNADEVLMLAATLSRAAGELERIQGGGL
jgi:hypothetical protein